MMKRALIALLAALVLAGPAKAGTIWEIGRPDFSAREFALYPTGFNDFILGFGGYDQYYLVGRDQPKERWPYILPGLFDYWGGNTSWAWRVNFLNAAFYLDSAPAEKARLIVSTTTHNALPAPIMWVEVNDHVVVHDFTLIDREIKVDLPLGVLRPGLNIVRLSNRKGSSVIFDSVRLEGPASFKLGPARSALVYPPRMSEFEQEREGTRVQPVLVEVFNAGQTVERLTVEVDGKEVADHSFPRGRSCLEVPLPAVTAETPARVRVLQGADTLADVDVTRGPRPLETPADLVDIFRGTVNSRWMIGPGPWMPMGFVKLSPDNEPDKKWKSGYDYTIESIHGFSHIHEWSMAGLLMMPTTGPLITTPGVPYKTGGWRSDIDKRTEVAHVGYYAVDLLRYKIRAELTATTRASLMRYTFPGGPARVIVSMYVPAEYGSVIDEVKITKVSPTEIEGWSRQHCRPTRYRGDQNYVVNFVVQFSKPMTAMDGWVGKKRMFGIETLAGAGPSGVLANVETAPGETVLVRTGISLVSVENARQNLTEEIVKPFGWDFEAVVQNQRRVWNGLLGRAMVETDDRAQKVRFYTCLYRVLSGRGTMSDINGDYTDMFEQPRRMTEPGAAMYSGDAFWGSHWNLNQVYNLLAPEIASNWVKTELEFFRAGGWTAKGPAGVEYNDVMMGAPEIPLMVSAYQSGVRDYDVDLLWQAILHQQTTVGIEHPGGGFAGNEHYDVYLKLGYIPTGVRGYGNYNSSTLEYAYQDWCAGQLASALGHEAEAKMFAEHGHNWKNIVNPRTGFASGRDAKGKWLNTWKGAEATAWQYTWHVPHEPEAQAEYVGRERYLSRLTEGFEQSEPLHYMAPGDVMSRIKVNQGNQPMMHVAWLFNRLAEPWQTQRWVRSILDNYYGDTAFDAFPGDEDQGQMSGWLVMASLGLFQIDGGCATAPRYEIAAPVFPRVTLKLSDRYYGGRTFTIIAAGASPENQFIQSARLNGVPYNRSSIAQAEVLAGGTLELTLGPEPNQDWGNGE